MTLLKKFQHWKLNKSRTEAFSDGVFAIIITLLILEIKMPHLKDPSSYELLMSLMHMAPKIISWGVSFFLIAVIWLQHHNLFRMADKIDYALIWLNSLTLLFVCFLPFPTAMMGEYPENRIAILLFGAIATCATFMQTCMYYYIAEFHLLPRYNKISVKKNVKRSFLLAPFLLIIATAVSFIHIYLPYLIYGLVPFFFLLPFDKEE